jgi:8-oxo-dGTP diphosphatase
MLRRIRVVAAMIQRNDGRYLITQRPPHATMPLLWEFPGGRAEEAETDEEALSRELAEEMGIEVEVGAQALRVEHTYPDYEIDFRVYHGRIVDGAIQHIRVHDHRWVRADELDRYQFPGADARSMDMLIKGDA